METNAKNSINNYQCLCLYCDRAFPTVREQESHVEREHKTVLCKGKGSRKSERIIKNNSALENIPFPGCFYCNKKVSKADDLDILYEHLLTSHKDVFFGCKCKIRKLDKVSLAHHKKHCKVAGDLENARINGDFTCDNLSEDEDIEKSLPATAIHRRPDRTRPMKVHQKNANAKKTSSGSDDVKDENEKVEYEIPLTRNKLKSSTSAVVSHRTSKKSHKATRLNDSRSNITSLASPIKSQRIKANKSASNNSSSSEPSDASSQKLEPASVEFEKDFYHNISRNIRENLSFHVDGKRDRLKHLRVFDQLSEVTKYTNERRPVSLEKQIHESTNFELSTPFPALLTTEQYGFGDTRKKLPRQITKNSWKWRWDLIKKYKYMNEGGKIVKKVKKVATSLKDLSQLDMWTQLSMRSRYENLNAPSTGFDGVLSESLSRKMIKTQNVEQLNTILDKRLALNIDAEQREQTIIKVESDECDETANEDFSNGFANIKEDPVNDQLQMFGLKRTAPIERKEPLLSGEWARPRCYICFDCGQSFDLMKTLNEHKNSEHPYIVSTHYEVVGHENLNHKLYKKLFLPKKAFEISGFARSSSICSDSKSNETNEASTSSDNSSKFSEDQKEKECSKCLKTIKYSNDYDIFRHVLDCIEDKVWMQAKRRNKYRKSRRKSRKGATKKSRLSVDQKKSSSPSNKDNTEGESCQSMSNPPTPNADLNTSVTTAVTTKKIDEELVIDEKKLDGKPTNGNLSIKSFFRVSKAPITPAPQKLVVQMMEISDENSSIRNSLRPRNNARVEEQPKHEVKKLDDQNENLENSKNDSHQTSIFTPLSVCTPVAKSLNDPLISPSSNASLTSPTLSNSNVPKKKKKLNDCIAMLTCKIQEKLGVNFFDEPSEGRNNDENQSDAPSVEVSAAEPLIQIQQIEPENLSAQSDAPILNISTEQNVIEIKPKPPSTSFQIASLLGDTLCEPVQEEVIDLSLKKTDVAKSTELQISPTSDANENVQSIDHLTVDMNIKLAKPESVTDSSTHGKDEKPMVEPINSLEKSSAEEVAIDTVEMKKQEDEVAQIQHKEDQNEEISIEDVSKDETSKSDEALDISTQCEETLKPALISKSKKKARAPPRRKATKKSRATKKNTKSDLLQVSTGEDAVAQVSEENDAADKNIIANENSVELNGEEPIHEKKEPEISTTPDESSLVQAEKSVSIKETVPVEPAKFEEEIIEKEDFKIRIPKRKIPNLRSILVKKPEIRAPTPAPVSVTPKSEPDKVTTSPPPAKTNNCNLKISEEERRAFEEQKNRIQQILNKSKQSNVKKAANKTPKKKIAPQKKTPAIKKKQKIESNLTPDAPSKSLIEDSSIKLEQTIKAANRVRCRRLSVVIDPIVNLSNFQTNNRKIRLTNNSQQNGFYELLTASENIFSEPAVKEIIAKGINIPAVEVSEKLELPVIENPEIVSEPETKKVTKKSSKKVEKKPQVKPKRQPTKNEIVEKPPPPEPTLVEDVLKPRAAKSQAIGLMSADKPQKKKPTENTIKNSSKPPADNSKSKKKKVETIESESAPLLISPENDANLETAVMEEKPASHKQTPIELLETAEEKPDVEVKDEPIAEPVESPPVPETPVVSLVKIDEIKPEEDVPVVKLSVATPRKKPLKITKKGTKHAEEIPTKTEKTSAAIDVYDFSMDDIDTNKTDDKNVLRHEKNKSAEDEVDTFDPFTINDDSLFNDDENDPSDKINDIVNNIINSSELQNDSETEKSECNATSFDDKNQNSPVCTICRRSFRNEKVYEKHCKTSTHIMKIERKERFQAKKIQQQQAKSSVEKAPSTIHDEMKTFRTKGALKTFDNIVELPVAIDKPQSDMKCRSNSLSFLSQTDDDNKTFFDIEKVEKNPEDMTAKDKDQLFDSLFNSLEANALSDREKSKAQPAPPTIVLPDSEIESSSTSWDLKNEVESDWNNRLNNAENSPISKTTVNEQPEKKALPKVNKAKDTVVSIPTKSLIMGKIFKKHRDREKQKTPQADAPMNKPEIKNSLDEIFDHLKNTSEIDDRVLTCPSPKTLLLRGGETFSPNSSKSNDMLKGASHSNNNNNNIIFKTKAPEKLISDIKKGVKSDVLSKKRELLDSAVKRMPRRRCAEKTKTLAETWSSDEYEELHDTEDIISIINEIERRESMKKTKQQKIDNLSEDTSDQKAPSDEKTNEKKIQFSDGFSKAASNNSNGRVTKKRLFDVATKDGYKSEEEVLTSSKEILPSKPFGAIKKRRMSCFVPSTKSSTFDEKLSSSQSAAKVFKIEREVLEKFNKVNNTIELESKPKLSNNNYKKSESEKSFTKLKAKQKSQKQRKKSKNRIKNIAYDTDSDFEMNISKKQKAKAPSECMSSDEDDNESVITTKTGKSISTAHMTAMKESKLLPNDLKSNVHSTISNDKAAIIDEDTNETAIKSCNRTKRQHSTEKLYYWSSSSDSEADNVQQGDIAEVTNEEPATPHQQPEQHGWIVGDSHKKLVTLLAHAKIKNKIN